MQLTPPQYHNPITPLPLLRALFWDWPSLSALVPRENLIFFRIFGINSLPLWETELSRCSSLTSIAGVSFNLRIIYIAVSHLLLSCPSARNDKEDYLFSVGTHGRTRVCAAIPSFISSRKIKYHGKIPPVGSFPICLFHNKFDQDYSSGYNSVLPLILRVRRK